MNVTDDVKRDEWISCWFVCMINRTKGLFASWYVIDDVATNVATSGYEWIVYKPKLLVRELQIWQPLCFCHTLVLNHKNWVSTLQCMYYVISDV